MTASAKTPILTRHSLGNTTQRSKVKSFKKVFFIFYFAAETWYTEAHINNGYVLERGNLLGRNDDNDFNVLKNVERRGKYFKWS